MEFLLSPNPRVMAAFVLLCKSFFPVHLVSKCYSSYKINAGASLVEILIKRMSELCIRQPSVMYRMRIEM